ncbi:hypothetical protein DFR29_11375 [Tahibacter aquaticus]|uniref:DUF2959 family protein n=1 Tax=Tahibacter aquaticus TaxID=520092 RepID=A0A4R6YQX8_9GAMM|nr:DUF2959 family protein [Tahibacter aquaticus]TDR40375.1 hypothetical protein DFR29_11375 [Tahibacter aquaticus]
MESSDAYVQKNGNCLFVGSRKRWRGVRAGTVAVLLFVVAVALLTGCQSAYFGALEKIGIAKRELLLDRVDAARDSQGEAEQAYVDALTAFRAVVSVEAGELESVYLKLKASHDEASARAQAFGERVAAVESVADALFKEWEGELAQYSDASLRAKSKAQLERTRSRYRTLDQAMRRAQASFQPALKVLGDQVLYLKHNLNAAAIGAIKDELPRLQADAANLQRDVQKATAEADRFLKEFRVEGN